MHFGWFILCLFGNTWCVCVKVVFWLKELKWQIVLCFFFLSLQSLGSDSPSPPGAESSSRHLLQDDSLESSPSSKEVCSAFYFSGFSLHYGTLCKFHQGWNDVWKTHSTLFFLIVQEKPCILPHICRRWVLHPWVLWKFKLGVLF